MKMKKITVRDITLIGMMVAVIEVCKAALSFLPNIELTTFWLILFTLYFGRKILLVIPVFILIEGCIYGFGLWWVMYLYMWPLLVLLVWILKKHGSVWFFSTLSGLFGLFFGVFLRHPLCGDRRLGRGNPKWPLCGVYLVGGRDSLGYRPRRGQFCADACVVPSCAPGDGEDEKQVDLRVSPPHRFCWNWGERK